MRAVVLALLLAACGSDADKGDASALECASEVPAGSDGEPDPCELQACQACVDACGSECAIFETGEVTYECPDDSWTASDICGESSVST